MKTAKSPFGHIKSTFRYINSVLISLLSDSEKHCKMLFSIEWQQMFHRLMILLRMYKHVASPSISLLTLACNLLLILYNHLLLPLLCWILRKWKCVLQIPQILKLQVMAIWTWSKTPQPVLQEAELLLQTTRNVTPPLGKKMPPWLGFHQVSTFMGPIPT